MSLDFRAPVVALVMNERIEQLCGFVWKELNYIISFYKNHSECHCLLCSAILCLRAGSVLCVTPVSLPWKSFIICFYGLIIFTEWTASLLLILYSLEVRDLLSHILNLGTVTSCNPLKICLVKMFSFMNQPKKKSCIFSVIQPWFDYSIVRKKSASWVDPIKEICLESAKPFLVGSLLWLNRLECNRDL